MAYFLDATVHKWLIENVTPAQMRKATGRDAAFVNKRIASGSLTLNMVTDLLHAFPCPLVGPEDMPPPRGVKIEPVAETEAEPDTAPEPIPAEDKSLPASAQADVTPAPAAMPGQARADLPAALTTKPASPPFPIMEKIKAARAPAIVHGLTPDPDPGFSNLADALPDGVKLMILSASNQPVHPQTQYCIQTLIDIGKGKIVLGEPESIYDLFMARNRLADRFLQSKQDWSLWLDRDVLVPCERPQWFKRQVPASRRWQNPMFASLNTVGRLAQHHVTDKTKKLVAGTYYDRFGRGVPMFAAGRSNADIQRGLNNQGPRDAVISAGSYAGTGCLLAHRQVYLDIMEKLPMEQQAAADLRAAPWEGHSFDFFGKIRYQGDDVSFMERARLAGHQPFTDLAVCCGHLGDYGYSHEPVNAGAT